MRTKALWCAAALAAGVVSLMAQSNVYSLNVVGYVNTTFQPGFNLVNNPLNQADNHLNNIMVGAQIPDGTQAVLWDPATQDFSAAPPPTYVAAPAPGHWINDVAVNPGMGVFILAFSGPFTNTFVGDVKQGTTAVGPLVPGFNTFASPVPIGGDPNAVLAGLVGNDGDQVFGFDSNPAVQDFKAAFTYNLSTHLWVQPSPPQTIGVGDGLFYINFGASGITWNRSFTVAP